MNRSWIFLKLLILVIVLAFAGRSFGGNACSNKNWAYVGIFENKAPTEYIVCKSCQGAFLEDPKWQKVLHLYAYDEANFNNSIAKTSFENNLACGQIADILLKDSMQNGCILKIEPAEGNSDFKTYYISSGVKSSGICKNNYQEGPFDILISNSYFELNDHPVNDDEKTESVIKKVRYCSYDNAILRVVIYKDGIQIEPYNKAYVLDSDKIVF